MPKTGKKGQSTRRSLRNVDVENINKELAKINECITNGETMDQSNSNTPNLSKKINSKSNLKKKSGKNNKHIDDSKPNDNFNELTKNDDGKTNENDKFIDPIDSNESTAKSSKNMISKSNLKRKSRKNIKYHDDSAESDDNQNTVNKSKESIPKLKSNKKSDKINKYSDDSESDDNAEELINITSGKTKINENSINQTFPNSSTSKSTKKHKSSLKKSSDKNIKYYNETKSNKTTEKLLGDKNEESTEESYSKYSKNKSVKKPVKCSTTKPKQTETADDKNSSDELSETEYEVQKIVEVKFFKNGKREFLIRWKGYKAEDDTWEKEENLNCQELLQTFMENLEQNKNLIDRELRPQRTATKRLIMNVDHLKRRTSKRQHIEINYQED